MGVVARKLANYPKGPKSFVSYEGRRSVAANIKN